MHYRQVYCDVGFLQLSVVTSRLTNIVNLSVDTDVSVELAAAIFLLEIMLFM